MKTDRYKWVLGFSTFLPPIAGILLLWMMIYPRQTGLPAVIFNVASKTARAENFAVDTFAANNFAVDNFAVDIVLAQTVFPTGTVYPGQEVLFNLTFTNTGTTPVSDVIVEDIIPPAFIPTDIRNSGATIEDISEGQPYRWRVGPLGAGARASIYIGGRIDPTLTASLALTNTAIITGEADIDTSNNLAQVTLDVLVPTVSFNTTRYALNEANRRFPMEVRVTNPNPYAALTVRYATTDGTAQSQPQNRRDFAAVDATLVISAGYPSRQLFIPILDDAISEGPELLTVALSQPQGASLGATKQVSLTIIDDDSAGVNISPSSIEVAEAGATDVYSVLLQSQPVTNVTIFVAPDSSVSTSQSELHFTGINWQTAQTVTVTALDDKIAEGIQESIIRHTVQSADANYNDTHVADVIAVVRDDDAAGLTIAPDELRVAEAALEETDVVSYVVSLKSLPTSDVVVQIEPGDQLRVDPSALVFSKATWNTPQRVTVAAIDDLVAEGEGSETIAHTIVSQDAYYADAATPQVAVYIADNDTPGLIFSQQAITITENANVVNATSFYDVVLNSQPTDMVTITIQGGATFSITPSILQFDAENWATPQPIAVSVQDDNTVRGRQSAELSHSFTSADAAYAALESRLMAVTVIDNDHPGLNYQAAEPLTISEGGAPISSLLTLASQPTEAVTVTVTISDSQIVFAPMIYLFTPDVWNVPQAGTITAVDDELDEGLHTAQVHFATRSSDANYVDLQNDIELTILDNDGARPVYLPIVRR